MTFHHVVALSGGVGGARFIEGLARALPPDALTCVVNTGDDFTHLGLHIAPDLDTVMYWLAGLAHEERGWGLAEESFALLDRIRVLGGPAWFLLGDRDLATHILRSDALRRGETLTAITARLSSALGVKARILPMADVPRPTMIETVTEGVLPFQEWFVTHRAVPAVRSVRFDGEPTPAPGVLDAITSADLVLIGPSNPYVSIDPILALDGVRAALEGKTVIAVSPIVGGKAIKGPLATMISELAKESPSAGAIAKHYGALLSGMVVERGDEHTIASLPVRAADTVMTSAAERLRLAKDVLDFAGSLA